MMGVLWWLCLDFLLKHTWKNGNWKGKTIWFGYYFWTLLVTFFKRRKVDFWCVMLLRASSPRPAFPRWLSTRPPTHPQLAHWLTPLQTRRHLLTGRVKRTLWAAHAITLPPGSSGSSRKMAAQFIISTTSSSSHLAQTISNNLLRSSSFTFSHFPSITSQYTVFLPENSHKTKFLTHYW